MPRIKKVMKRSHLNTQRLMQNENVGHLYVGRVFNKPNIIKVGRTKNLLSRLMNLQNEHGNRFEFIYISKELYNYVEAEEIVLDYLNKHDDPCFQTEWFNLGDNAIEALITTIKSIESISDDLFAYKEWEKVI